MNVDSLLVETIDIQTRAPGAFYQLNKTHVGSFNISPAKPVIKPSEFANQPIVIDTAAFPAVTIFQGYIDDFSEDNKFLMAPDFQSVKSMIRQLYLTECSIDRIEVYHNSLLFLDHCLIDGDINGAPVTINCSGIDTIYLRGLIFRGPGTILRLQNESERRPVLILDNLNADHIEFDYTKFSYNPYISSIHSSNRRKSAEVQNFADIIATQRRQNNLEGIKAASIDSCKYEDERENFGPLLSAVKMFWNEYGYNKGRVLWSSFLIFLFFTVCNSLIFGKLLNAYPIKNIKIFREKLAQKGKLRRYLRSFPACLLYTGYIFYGFKLNINDFRLKNLWLVYLVLFEFSIGLISLGYIANYIITK